MFNGGKKRPCSCIASGGTVRKAGECSYTTERLVARWPYQFSRNPMYLGVLGILLAEAMLWNIAALWGYAGVVFALFHLFIVYREEPRLRRDFGRDYEVYCEQVRRWGFIWRL